MVETLSDLFLNTVKSFPKDNIMMVKKEGKYVSISTDEFKERVIHFSCGLSALGLHKGDKLVILSENRPEWVMTDIATICQGGITVPIYTSLVPEQIRYIIEDSDAKIVVYSNGDQWPKLNKIKDSLKKVQHFISLSADVPEEVISYNRVLEKGKEVLVKDPQFFEKTAKGLQPEDTASIIYTSGTTGIPKGVILSHKNFVSNVKTTAEIIEFTVEDTTLSFLPLSHVLERMVTFAYLYKGCSIAYAESVEKVADNLVEVRPQIMVSVPRVFEKIYSRVMDMVLSGSSLKKKIFFWAVKVGKEYGRRQREKYKISGFLRFKRNIAHKLVFSKIIEKTGGRVRFFISGGAPLSKDIAEFFYAMGLLVLEGYGLTETSPVIAVNTIEEVKFGSVGRPIPGVDVKIADDGEILAKGPNVMKGYYKKEAETREVFENEWFKTGDIGYLDEDGFLFITDRKKDLIVTTGGKNVAPQPIENKLKTNPYISNIVVIGDKRKYIAALVVPDFEKIGEYARANNIAYSQPEDLVQNDQVRHFLEAEIKRMTPDLATYEEVKRIVILPRDFEIEQDEITPTLKIKRNIIENKYKKEIDALYAEVMGGEEGFDND
ncbi:MAG: long-chain fatty acid--CoA ligase [Candidatus Aminicenantes bacterium]|nr:long-chain fatty acid--CoA ligase [Candidatus Aminicenantes bacterium]